MFFPNSDFIEFDKVNKNKKITKYLNTECTFKDIDGSIFNYKNKSLIEVFNLLYFDLRRI